MSAATPAERQRVRDRRGLHIVIWLAAATVLVALSALFPKPTIASQLADAVERSDSVVLADLEAVDGSSFLVVCPYEPRDSVVDRLGFDTTEVPDLEGADGRQSLLFVEGAEVVERVDLARKAIDFCETGDWLLLPTDIELEATRDGDVVRLSP